MSRARDLVLVVDDDRTMRLLARQSLEVAGIAVEEARGGCEALEAAARLRPALVLLDVAMPDLDGFTVCQRLRELPATADTPIVMMTALNDVESVRRAYEVGATDFIEKPPNWVILSQRVRYALRASQTMTALRRSESKLASAQGLVNLGWWEWDLSRDEFHCSEGLFQILGIDPSAAEPSYAWFMACMEDEARGQVRESLEEVVRQGGSASLEYSIGRPDGTRCAVHQRARATCDGTGATTHLVCALQDITDRKQSEEQIRYLAFFDGLTGLPNRRLFRDRLDHALETARRHQRMTAVLFLDLDRFKRVNDTLGHGVGDELLRAAGERLGASMRTTDCVGRGHSSEGEPLVARLGGDEFIILLGEISRVQDAARVALRVVEALAAPFPLGGHELTVTASIGIAVFPFDAEGAEDLMKNADTAMYFAKEQGRNNYQFYTESMNATAFERLVLEERLRRAVERREFVLHFQPLVEAATGRIVGAEALVRWHHSELGLVPPLSFIPLAEETGLIVPLGDWVLEQACAQAVAWQAKGLPPLRLAVNVSGRQFRTPGFIDGVARVLVNSGLAPHLLDLELTETVIMADAQENIQALQRLKELGVKVTVDDFGTGYSSLSYLKRFPLDTLKIDRSFLVGVPGDPDHVAIATAIIAMARSLRLSLVAEGIETEAQLAFIRDGGCQEFQGYLVSAPLPADRFEALVRKEMAAPAPDC